MNKAVCWLIQLRLALIFYWTCLSNASCFTITTELTFGGVAGSIPLAAFTLLIVINFLTFLSLLGKSIKGEMKMKTFSKKVCARKTETCENNKATKHVRFYTRYIAQFIEIAVSMSVSVMAAGSACFILKVGAAVVRSPRCFAV